MTLTEKRRGQEKKNVCYYTQSLKVNVEVSQRTEEKFPSLNCHSCGLKNFSVNLEIHRMFESRLLKVYHAVHRSMWSPCGLNQTPNLQLNLRTFFNSPITGFIMLHHQLDGALFYYFGSF